MTTDADYNQFMDSLDYAVKTRNKSMIEILLKPFVKAGYSVKDILNLKRRR